MPLLNECNAHQIFLHQRFQPIAEISLDAFLIRLDLYSCGGCANTSAMMMLVRVYIYDCIYL